MVYELCFRLFDKIITFKVYILRKSVNYTTFKKLAKFLFKYGLFSYSKNTTPVNSYRSLNKLYFQVRK